MANTDEHQIVPGISVTSAGQATVASSLTDVLFDLAGKLEEATDLPVDVEHILAAIILAARQGELDADTPLSADDPALVDHLKRHVQTVFADYGGRLGEDD